MAAEVHSRTSLQGVTLNPKEQCSPEMHLRMRLGEEEASGSQRLLTGNTSPDPLLQRGMSAAPALPCGIQLSLGCTCIRPCLCLPSFPALSCFLFPYRFLLGDLPQQKPHRRIPVSSSVSRRPNLRNLPSKSTLIAMLGTGEILVFFLF